MSKVTQKNMVDDYAELTAKHAHTDISSVDAGVVTLVTGDEAKGLFITLRTIKDYYKPHQIYHAVFRPEVVGQIDPQGGVITAERVAEHQTFRVPARHHMQSKGTYMDCAKAHPDVFDAEPDFNSYMKVMDGEPAPAGTPLIVKFLYAAESESSPRFGVYSTEELHAKDRYNMEKTMRTYLCTRIIPKMGRAILKDTSSRAGVKTVPVRGDDGSKQSKVVTCTEVRKDGSVCAGEFRRDSRGDHVCQNCGIIFQREDIMVSENETEEVIEFDDDYAVEATSTIEDFALGSMPYGTVAAKERLIAKFEFQMRLTEAPSDEARAKTLAEADYARHKKAQKAFKKMNGHQVYEHKWTDKQASYRKAKIIALVKTGGVTTGMLSEVLGVGSKQLYRMLAELETSGRITSEKVGKATVLTYVH